MAPEAALGTSSTNVENVSSGYAIFIKDINTRDAWCELLFGNRVLAQFLLKRGAVEQAHQIVAKKVADLPADALLEVLQEVADGWDELEKGFVIQIG